MDEFFDQLFEIIFTAIIGKIILSKPGLIILSSIAVVWLFVKIGQVPMVTIKDLSVRTNVNNYSVSKSKKKGVQIILDFNAYNFKGHNCEAVAYFESSNGTKLKDSNGRYKSVDGQVSSSKKFRPVDHRSTYSDFKIFIPEDEFHLDPGSSNLEGYVQIFCDGKSFAKSEYFHFYVDIPGIKIKDLSVRENTYYYDYFGKRKKGLTIDLDFTAINLKAKNCQAAAYFYHSNGTKLKDFNSHYKSVDGQVSSRQKFRPSYRSSTYKNLKIFTPYDELHFSQGRHKLKGKVEIFCNGKSFAKSRYFYFEYEKTKPVTIPTIPTIPTKPVPIPTFPIIPPR